MALNISISKELNTPSRFLGENNTTHPFIKGYFYVFFQFPKIVTEAKAGANSNILLSLCESFTPPGDRQIKTEDVTGIGGVDASYITGQTLDRNFSLMFRDIWGSPVFQTHRLWTSIIDPWYGGNVKKDIKFIPDDYKGKVLVIQTRPHAIYSNESTVEDSVDIIEKVFYFKGVVPTVDLNSIYDSNITDNSIIRPTIQYRFDGAPIDETYNSDVKTKALAILKTIKVNENRNYDFTQTTI